VALTIICDPHAAVRFEPSTVRFTPIDSPIAIMVDPGAIITSYNFKISPFAGPIVPFPSRIRVPRQSSTGRDSKGIVTSNGELMNIRSAIPDLRRTTNSTAHMIVNGETDFLRE
jgi:hypothetical protein